MLYHCKAASSAAHNVLPRTAMGSKEDGSAKQWDGTSQGVVLTFVFAFLALALTLGCDVERRKSDAELGLNAQQAAGRKIYDSECDRCHEPYSTKGKKGPGLKGVFQHKYLSLSGLPANDERVTDIIRLGRNEMPGYAQKLNQQDIQDLLAYLHTL
jgi:mono/diheme cytochrome c family protein